jgi:hypothetical protein
VRLRAKLLVDIEVVKNDVFTRFFDGIHAEVLLIQSAWRRYRCKVLKRKLTGV